MDVGYTYANNAGVRCAVYAPPGYEPPDTISLIVPGAGAVPFARLSDRELDCGDVRDGNGRCTSWECHRAVLGECACGRHKSIHSTDPEDTRPPVRIRKATA